MYLHFMKKFAILFIVRERPSSIAQSVEHAAVNRAVVGSSPTRGGWSMVTGISGPMVKRLRHRPFTAVTRVRISLGSLATLFSDL